MAVSATAEVRRSRFFPGLFPALLLFFLWVAADGVCGKVQKQVVMFHQYPVRVDVDLEARTAIVSPPDNIPGLGKSRTFYDYNTRVIAYKDYKTKQCHLERMSEDEKLPGTEEESMEQGEQSSSNAEGSQEREAEMRLHRQLGLLGPSQHNRNRQKRAPQQRPIPTSRRRPKTLYVTETVLTKYEVYRWAGRRISHFCRGFPATLLVPRRPSPPPKLQSPSRVPWLSENELPGDGDSADLEEHKLMLEAALAKARLAELELQTLDSSDEENQQVRGKSGKGISRSKRQATSTGGSGANWPWPRKYKGQTQSQFVSFGGDGKGEGAAQAESRPDGTTTVVRGVNGMGQSQSQSSVGDGCEGCYPGGAGYPAGTYPGGTWQAEYGTGRRVAPGAITGSTGADGLGGAGRDTGVGTSGARGYRPVGAGNGRPRGPGYDGNGGMSQGQYLRPGPLTHRPGATDADIPGYGGIPGVAPGRGLPGGRGYGVDGTGLTVDGSGYRIPGREGDGIYGRPTGAGYLDPSGHPPGYGTQNGVRAPGYRGPGGVNGQIGTTGGGDGTRPINGGTYAGRPGYGRPSVSGQPGYGHTANGLSQRPTGPSGHVQPGAGIRGPGGVMTIPGTHGAYPLAPGQQVTSGIPSAHGGQHLGPGLLQRPGAVDYGAPGYGEGDRRPSVGIPGGVGGTGVPTAHGGLIAGVPSSHGVSGHGIYGPGTGPVGQTVNGYGTYPGAGDITGRGVHAGRGHHVPSAQGGQVGLPRGHIGAPRGHVGIPGGHGGVVPGHGGMVPGHGGMVPGHGGMLPGHGGAVPGHGGMVPGHGGISTGQIPGRELGTTGHGRIPGHPGIPGGQVGVHRGHVGAPGGHAGIPGEHIRGPGHPGIPGGPVGIPGGHLRPGLNGYSETHGADVGHPGQPGLYGRYPTGHAGHGLTGPGGYRPGGVVHRGDHLTPEGIRAPPRGTIGGRYPDGGTLTPGGPGIVGGQRPDGTLVGRYPDGSALTPGGPTAPGIVGGQRPDGSLVGTGPYGRPTGPGYPRGQIPGYRGNGQYGTPGYYNGQAYPLTRPGEVGRGTADAGESQAQSSVTQDDKEIKAGASSQGKLGDGKAQAQVSGSYSGTGSFSAQAQTSDGGKGAQSQVTGNKDGGSSSAQGNGGSGQSQAQVQLSSSSGATKAEAQSGGWQHGSNTQVQAGENGGMADAQSSGPGTTSSQAQVGFKPYRPNGSAQRTPFRGGGTASAQSSSFSGQSQSQVQGAYRYGVSFTGAAQAGSGARGSRGASGGSTVNGTQRFERDDHAASFPDSLKLTPLRNFGGIASSPQLETGESTKAQEALGSQTRGDGRTIQRENHSSMHESHHHASSHHQTRQPNANNNSPFNGNSHNMQNPHLKGTMNGQASQMSGNGQTQTDVNHGMSTDSSNTQHTGSGMRGSMNGHPINMKPEESLNGMNGLRTQKIDQNENRHRQPESEYPRFDSNMNGGSNPGGNVNVPGGETIRGMSPHSDVKPSVFKTESPGQSQAVFVSPTHNEDVHITQASDGGGIPAQAVYLPGQVVPGSSGYVIPEGFRGRVVEDGSRSIAGDETFAVASPNRGNSQSQTVILTPGSGKVNYTRIVRPPHGQPVVPAYDDYGQNQGIDEEAEPPTQRSHVGSYMGSDVYTRGDQHIYSRNKAHTRSAVKSPVEPKTDDDYDDEDDEEDDEDDGTDEDLVPSSSPSPLPNSYVSVTKSVSGQLSPPRGVSGSHQNGNRGTDGGKFAHTYYTKSSTCGYFTFSCNVVFGSNGRAKICKPLPPTNPDGSPCCC